MQGKIVKTKNGLIGITKGEVINGKIVVYVGDKKLLCNAKELILIGFQD